MAAEYKARVGERIREAREAKGWSQAALARELPGTVDGPSVSRWERGKVAPNPDTLEALADALDVDVSHFLSARPEAGTADLMGALAGESASQLDRIESKLDRILSLLAADAHEAELQGAAQPGRPGRQAPGSAAA